MRRHGRRVLVALPLVALALAVGCSAGDPPNPDAARATLPRPAGLTAPGPSVAGGAPAAAGEADHDEDDEHDEHEPELSDADDATLDAIEERFEDQGVKDVRGAPGEGVTIRLEDELTVADAAPFCAAVRAAGFPTVRVDIDGILSECP